MSASVPRVAPIPPELNGVPQAVEQAARAHVLEHSAHLTNMKRTLLHSLPAFDALMSWYPLRDTVLPILGERTTTLFAHAISAETDCLICSTFFRRILIDSGEDPDHLALDDRETAIVAFGRALATPPHAVADDLYVRVTDGWRDEEIVAVVSFGALMLATNVFNNALGVPLDDYLFPFRRATHGTPTARGE
jgi:alkylhydroperoxidase family enzyme